MTRRALIIANPGTPGAANYCGGVQKDVANYTAFLTSAVGGLWKTDEITLLEQPTIVAARREIAKLKTVEYSMTMFCGHGEHSGKTNTTLVELRPGVEMEETELRVGAPKHSLVLDCCRKIAKLPILLTDAMAKHAMDSKSSTIHPDDCRKYYDQGITDCPSGLVVLFACDVGQTAGDDASRGGFYSFSLLTEAKSWSVDTNVDTTKNYRTLSIVAAHDAAIPRVKGLSGDRQTPSITKPRSDPYFPFCIIA